MPNGWWSMPPEPVPADPGWDEDLAWLDRDPERETWLDRAREHDEPPLAEEYADHEPLAAQELAEIGEAAADELLAVGAATAGRRGPGQPGSARVFPGESSSPAAAFGPGMVFDLLPGCAQLAVAAGAAMLARPRTSRTDIPYMGTGLYGFSSGAVARGGRLSRPAGGAVLPCRDGRHRIVSYNVTINGGSAMAGYRPMTLAGLAGYLSRAADDRTRWKLTWEFLEEYRWESSAV